MIKGFKMKLYPGQEAEYERRHNLLWPEMKDPELWAKSADTPINRKWWDYMADIMETNPDNSPVAIDLQNVFHLD